MDLVQSIVARWLPVVLYSHSSHSAGQAGEMAGAVGERDTGRYLAWPAPGLYEGPSEHTLWEI